MESSICNQTKTTQFRLVHHLKLSPALRNKVYAEVSPLCWKCNSEIGNYIYCFRLYIKLQSSSSDIVDELSVIFGVQIELDPMCLLLGLPV